MLAKRRMPQEADTYLQFDRLDPTRGQDRMFVMKVAKDPKDWHRADQYERDVKTQLIAADFALRYNTQVYPKSHEHTL